MAKEKRQESLEDYLESMLMLKEQKGFIRSVDISRLLGVTKPSVSYATRKLREQGYITMDNLINTTKEELSNIHDIGNIIADSIINYFNDPKNINEINKLKELGINMKYLGSLNSKQNDLITGKTFVITGTLSKDRNEIKELLESYGGNVSGSVSKKTDVVIKGDNPGSKYDKAVSLGITIWGENELNDVIKDTF